MFAGSKPVIRWEQGRFLWKFLYLGEQFSTDARTISRYMYHIHITYLCQIQKQFLQLTQKTNRPKILEVFFFDDILTTKPEVFIRYTICALLDYDCGAHRLSMEIGLRSFKWLALCRIAMLRHLFSLIHCPGLAL